MTARPQSRPQSRRAAPLALAGVLASSLLVLLVTTLPVGCSSSLSASAKKSTNCTVGEYYYCRCADRQEGSWLCQEDFTFGRCEPCERDDNPATEPDPEPVPVPEKDSGPITTCGDGTAEYDEDCDDGNDVEDDGCDGKCRLAGANPLASRACPGLAVHVWGTREVTFASTTAGSPNTGSVTPGCTGSSATPATGASAGDRVFQVTAHKTGTMTVATTETNFDGFLYATSLCRDRSKNEGGNAQLACANAKSTSSGETMTFHVEDGETYAVFVDGVLTAQGNFKVTFTIP